jgi:hypothetical protein
MTQYAIKTPAGVVVGLIDSDIAPEIVGENIAVALAAPMLNFPEDGHKGGVWTCPVDVLVWRDDRTLEECRTEKNAEINQKRLLANRTSFVFAGKTIACDELSMLDIQSLNGIVALIGSLPPGFANEWKAIDNTYVAIPDKATWIAFMGAMVSTGQANFDRAQELKAALAAATTNADVDAITW